MDICFSKPLQGCDIVINILFFVGGAYLDGIMDIDTFNASKGKSGIFNFLFQSKDIVHFPGFAGLCTVECGNDTGNAGNLPDLF